MEESSSSTCHERGSSLRRGLASMGLRSQWVLSTCTHWEWSTEISRYMICLVDFGVSIGLGT